MRFANGKLLKVDDADIQNGQFVFPEVVTSIGPKVFAGCKSLVSITIPDTVTHIGVGAFKDCLNLASVVIPNGVTSIENYAFKDCSKMASVVIPASVASIGLSAFDGCNSLESIVIPKGVTSIKGSALSNCSNLKSIVISDSVTSIGTNAFASCSAVSVIHIDAQTQEGYEKVFALLPDDFQKKIQNNYKLFESQALTLLKIHNHDAGFFKKNRVPKDITRELIANIARQYDIPPLMLQQTYRKFGVEAENNAATENKPGLNG